MSTPHPDQVKAGQIVGKTLTFIKNLCLKDEIRAETLEARTIEFIRDNGGIPALIGYKPPFCEDLVWKHAFCLSLNKEVVHGMPIDKIVRPIDLIKADIVIRVGDWHADAARTFSANPRYKRIIEDIHFAMDMIHRSIRTNVPISNVANTLKQIADGLHYYLIPGLGGHGIGKKIHDDPFIPNIPEPTSAIFKAQKSYAIEPVWAINKCILKLSDDGWTYVATQLSAHIENTYWFSDDGRAINLTNDKDDLLLT